MTISTLLLGDIFEVVSQKVGVKDDVFPVSLISTTMQDGS